MLGREYETLEFWQKRVSLIVVRDIEYIPRDDHLVHRQKTEMCLIISAIVTPNCFSIDLWCNMIIGSSEPVTIELCSMQW